MEMADGASTSRSASGSTAASCTPSWRRRADQGDICMNPAGMRFTTAEQPLLPMERARVLFDGLFAEPRLAHPEGVAVGPDGWVWCGTETGDILRVAPDGSTIEPAASTGGFVLGLAFDGDRALFACDLKHAAVFRLDLVTRDLARFTPPGIKIPNYPVVDKRHGRLLVSDSHGFGVPGPGVWAY